MTFTRTIAGLHHWFVECLTSRQVMTVTKAPLKITIELPDAEAAAMIFNDLTEEFSVDRRLFSLNQEFTVYGICIKFRLP